MTSLGLHGRSVDAVIADLAAKRSDDVRWADGKAFGMVFDGGPGVEEAATRAAELYLHENALNTNAFPSLRSIQSEVVGWTAELLNGPETAAGFLTSGGTESILCGVKAARDRGRTRTVLDNADRMRAGIAAPDGVRVLGDPRFHLSAMASDPAADRPIDVFAVADALERRGWYHDRQGPPDSLHSTVSNSNTGVIDDYLRDLAAAVEEVRGRSATDPSTGYATLE